MTTIEIFGPDITYQYTENGMQDSHGLCVEVPESAIVADASNVPALWQAAFREQWGRSSRDVNGVFARLRELEAETLAKLPDNPFAQRAAWLVGLLDDCPERQGIARRVAKIRTEVAKQKVREDARHAELERLQSLAEVVSQGKRQRIPGEEGADYAIHYIVRSRQTGRTYEFNARDVFDVGPVINPAYATAPGQRGGIAVRDSEGRLAWKGVRRLDEDEADCYRLVAAVMPFYGMRM